MWGTTGAHLMNMIKGVNESFTKKLILEGIGYKAEVKGTDLAMALGFSHPVKVAIPKTLKVTSDKGCHHYWTRSR
jgi:large subunit ribosomal protein L6